MCKRRATHDLYGHQVATSRSLIVEHFAKVCRDRGTAVAVTSLAEPRVYRAEAVWRAFQRCRQTMPTSIDAGTTVVVLLGNEVAFLPVLLALLDQGAVVIPLDLGATPANAVQVANVFNAAAIIGPADVEFPGTLERHAWPLNLVVCSRRCEPGGGGTGEPAVLKLTSGSTGSPRAVRCSEANLIADGCQIVEAMGIGTDDINLGVVPLSHSYGLGNLVMPFLLQGTGLALRSGFQPAHLWGDIATSRATVFPGVPFMFDYITRHLANQWTDSSLRLLISAAAPIHYETIETLHRLSGLKIHSFYGTSETGGIAYDDSPTLEAPPRVGRPMPAATVTLRDRVSVGAGAAGAREEGRIHVRGDAVAAGYAGQPQPADTATFCHGGFLTGDIGYLDRDDHLVLTGRVSRFVNVAGRKVHPEEVERVLIDLPRVSAARVLGAPCDTRGQMLVACIVPSSAATLTATLVRQHCAKRLPPHKVPRRYLFLDQLPTDARGKIDRHALQVMIGERQ